MRMAASTKATATDKWDNGLALRDWRYVVRIANIDVSNLSEPSSAANIAKLMVKALHRIPNRGMGRPVFYMNRTVGRLLICNLWRKHLWRSA